MFCGFDLPFIFWRPCKTKLREELVGRIILKSFEELKACVTKGKIVLTGEGIIHKLQQNEFHIGNKFLLHSTACVLAVNFLCENLTP